jgi:hypothetical protein
VPELASEVTAHVVLPHASTTPTAEAAGAAAFRCFCKWPIYNPSYFSIRMWHMALIS